MTSRTLWPAVVKAKAGVTRTRMATPSAGAEVRMTVFTLRRVPPRRPSDDGATIHAGRGSNREVGASTVDDGLSSRALVTRAAAARHPLELEDHLAVRPAAGVEADDALGAREVQDAVHGALRRLDPRVRIGAHLRQPAVDAA